MSAPLRFIGLCLGAVLTIGCDGAPPLLAPPPPPRGLIVLGPDIIRIELIAPPEIAPGEAVQLTANAIRSDGTAEHVSNQAEWTTNNTSVLPAGELDGSCHSHKPRGDECLRQCLRPLRRTPPRQRGHIRAAQRRDDPAEIRGPCGSV